MTSAPTFMTINTAPPHSTTATPVVPSPLPPGAAPGAGASPSSTGGDASTFWPWALALLLFWIIVVALHEYGGALSGVGIGFAGLVLTTVLLTQGGKAMTNAVALFKTPA